MALFTAQEISNNIYGAKQDNIIVTSASWQENAYATLEYRNKIKIHHNLFP